MSDTYAQIVAHRFALGTGIDGPLPWKVVGIEDQFSGKFLHLKEIAFTADATNSDGIDRKQWRSIVIMPDGMLVVPVTPDGKVVLVRVLRPGAMTQHWEFPQERFEPSGDHHNEAVRCAYEEAGLVGEPLLVAHVIDMPSMADRVTEITHVYVVVGNYDLGARTDKVEVADNAIGFFSFDEVLDLIAQKMMSCCCNIASALLVAQRRSEFGIA